jgi:hypothetical protein
MKRRNFLLGALGLLATPVISKAAKKLPKIPEEPKFEDPIPVCPDWGPALNRYSEYRMRIMRIDVYLEGPGPLGVCIGLIGEDEPRISGDVEAIWTEWIAGLEVGDIVKVGQFKGHCRSESLTFESNFDALSREPWGRR